MHHAATASLTTSSTPDSRPLVVTGSGKTSFFGAGGALALTCSSEASSPCSSTRSSAKEAIFNLKLPMKGRYDEVLQDIENLKQFLTENDVKYKLQAKHLYHDREEITVHLNVIKVPQSLYS